MTPEDFKQFIADSMAHNYIEAKIVRKVHAALEAAGTPIVAVYDGVETTPASTLAEVNELVFNLDECRLYTKGRSWVRIVLGNDWDALVDYTLDIEAALQPVNDWIEKHS